MFGRNRLERRLRAERPAPTEDFVRHLAATIAEEPAPVRRRSHVRLGVAAAVAVGSLVVAGVTGGLGYAANAASHASASLAHTVASPVGSGSTTTSSSINSSLVAATSSQYTTAGYYCFKTTHGNSYKEIFISNASDYLSYTGAGYVVVRYDAGQYLQSTCNYGHLK